MLIFIRRNFYFRIPIKYSIFQFLIELMNQLNPVDNLTRCSLLMNFIVVFLFMPVLRLSEVPFSSRLSD
jgi:hypothetical protein